MPRKSSQGSNFYAVRVGRNTGIYSSWAECQQNISGYAGAEFKKFGSESTAQSFIDGSNTGTGYGRSSSGYGGSSNNSGGCSAGGNNETVVYTDGASAGNGNSNARAGYGVYFGPNDSRNISAPLDGPRQTNQRAELQAIKSALDQTQGSGPVRICTDSKYAIDSVTKWSQNWERNGWTTSNGTPVQNQDLIKSIMDSIDQRGGNVQFEHVKGHAGIHGNEEADRLAVQGANKRY